MKRTPPGIRIMIVEDHAIVRHGIRSIIETQDDMQIVAEVESGSASPVLYADLRPDVVLLDLRIPGLDGIEVIERIIGVDASARILVLTTFDTDVDIVRSIRAGALGYLLKDCRGEDLVNAVREVNAGRRVMDASVSAKYVEESLRPELSPREAQILALLVEGKPNKRIAQDLAIGEATVKTHVISLFQKLGVRTRTAAARVAKERGLVDSRPGT